MTFKSTWSVVRIAAFTFLVSACSGNIYNPNATTTTAATGVVTSSMSCTISNVAVNGIDVTFSIGVTGGTASYTFSSIVLNGISGSLVGGSPTFASAATEVAAFTGLSIPASSSVSGTAVVTDADGTTASCPITAAAGTSSTSTLTCYALASIASPSVGQADTLTFTASGGTAPYTFSAFNAGAAVASQSEATVSATQHSATVAYSAAGNVTATIKLADNAGTTTTCSVPVNVQMVSTSSTGNGQVTTVPAGFFSVNGTMFYAPDTAHFCQVMSAQQLATMGGSASATAYGNVPTAMENDGQCPLPAGFFLANGAIWRADANHHFCQITSWTLWSHLGGPSNYPTYPVIPNTMVGDVQCRLPAGFFRLGGGGWYSDGGNVCSFVSMPHYYDSGAPDFNAVPDYSPLPNSMNYTGQCGWATGNPIYREHEVVGHFDFLFSNSGAEGPGYYVLDGQAFTLLSGNVPGSTAMYRCHTAAGIHFETLDPGCEGQYMEGAQGYVFGGQVTGSVPLYRLYHPPTGAHLTTKDQNEIAYALANGWLMEGGQGFAF